MGFSLKRLGLGLATGGLSEVVPAVIGKDPEIPGPSAAEQELTAAQTSSIREANELNRLLLPFILESQGLEEQVDPTTGARTFVKKALSPEQQRLEDVRGEVELTANERTLKALKGELDVDPSVEADIERGKSELTEQLYRSLGPGAEGSTAWNRAVAEYDRQANALRYDVRFGEMTSSEAIGRGREQTAQRRQSQLFGQQQATADPFLRTASATTSPLGLMQRERFGVGELEASNIGTRREMIGQAIGLAGTALGRKGG